jgi:cysteine desulfuration protein SufE
MTINERQNEIIEEFEMFEDWMDKYEYLISLGKELPLIKEAKKTSENIIKGCQSRVWLAADLEKSKVHYTADSDAIITKGIISLMIRIVPDSSPKEIMETELYFIDKVGLKEHLSPTRSNGLVSMVKQMKMYAIAYSSKV